ncbi:RNA polymerase sigma factor [Arenibacter sp. M-2]|uniref:RNA polymerase sigma factor n=1 Tax=unclassified Arenibacter TaxID=2615047 RepID=UPI000D76972D|nr:MULTISPECIES: RNA polymerase sigma factor [unclassified Arenibacter]MDL5513228.1 RNA polymerase sigma factor [Arenibacter sp. M-2]PXX29967.1 RNA polymerase sigma-70 factor (ECF subfamily) [Arenibacter sp. ARW7G5Y1]
MESENSTKLKDFFGKEYDSLRRYVATKISDTANRDAEDIIQDVALKLFSGADRYAPINNVAGFVYKSIRNRIIDVMRTTKNTNSVDMDNNLVDLVDVMHQVANSYSSEETVLLLKKCIDQLKPVYKDIIIAVDFEGYSYKEISNQTGISTGTLMSRRHRALGILYTKIEQKIIR